MPTRLVREGINTSEAVCSLGWAAEVFYRRLLNTADDYGRFSAHPSLLRAAMYALNLANVSDSDVSSWLAKCEQAGLVRSYSFENKRYVEVQKFNQQVRAKHSKYPAPEWHVLSMCAADAKQMQSACTSSAHLDGVVGAVGDEDGGGGGDDSCTEPALRLAAEASPSPAVERYPCSGKTTEWVLTEAKLAEYAVTYPGVDPRATARKAWQWCQDNPRKWKTAGGMPRFLSGWFEKAQNGISGHGGGGGTARPGAVPGPRNDRIQRILDRAKAMGAE